MALVSGAANLMPKLINLLNRTLREGGFFVRQAMPFLLACVEMVNKFFGGVFLLVAMVWRDVRQGSRRPSRPETPTSAALGMLQRNAPQGYNGSSYQRHLEAQSFPYRRENVQRPYFGSNARQS